MTLLHESEENGECLLTTVWPGTAEWWSLMSISGPPFSAWEKQPLNFTPTLWGRHCYWHFTEKANEVQS